MEGMTNSKFWDEFLGRALMLVSRALSGNIQPIDLKLKPLVDLDFNDRRCSFLCWGGRIDAVLFRHLTLRATKVVLWLSVFLRG